MLYLYQFFAPKKSMGFDALADFLGFLFISVFAVFILSIFLSRMVSQKNRMLIGAITSVIAAVIVIVVAIKIKGEAPPENYNRPITKPGSLNFQSQASDALVLDSLPLWVGRVIIDPSQPIYFQNSMETTSSIADSLVFSPNGEIVSAPPWLMPWYLKLDYNIFYFEVRSRSLQNTEITVNKMTGQSAWISNHHLQIMDQGEFLLNMSSIERKNPADNPLRLKPIANASEVVLPNGDTFLQPLMIKGDWIKVNAVGEMNYEVKATGWIRWRTNNKVVVSYNFLS